MFELDLKAEHCPNAMSLVRVALQRMSQHKVKGTVIIRTLEMSITPKIQQFIEHADLSIKILSEEVMSPTPERLSQLCADSERDLIQPVNEMHVTLKIF